MARIEFTDCEIPLTKKSLIELSKKIGSDRFYIKSIEMIRYKYSFDRHKDADERKVETVEVWENPNSDNTFVVRGHDFEYATDAVRETDTFTITRTIVGYCPVEFSVNEEEWKVAF